MSVREWLSRGSPKVLGAAVVSSLVAGLSFGLWLRLPPYLAEPVAHSPPGMIQAQDPGRAKWQEVVASLGGLGATFTIPAYLYTEPPPAVFERAAEREYDAALAESEDALAQAERREDEAWWRRQEMERDRREWRPRRVHDFTYRLEPVEPAAVSDDPYGYGPPPGYGPAPDYGPPPRYAARVDDAPHGPGLYDEVVVEAPEPPPRRASGWR